jgi:hypothetical protein
VSNGIEAIKVPFLAANLLRAISTQPTHMVPAWLRRGEDFYFATLKPSKPEKLSGLSTPESGLRAAMHGNWLHFQPKETAVEGLRRAGRDWAHHRLVEADAAEADAAPGFVKDALQNGHTVVNGPSGQTHMMAVLGRYLSSIEVDFPLSSHYLNTMTALVFDGGHSTEDVLYTLDLSQKGDESPSEASALMKAGAPHTLHGYDAIAKLSDNDADAKLLRERLDKALDRTVDYYATHLARE